MWNDYNFLDFLELFSSAFQDNTLVKCILSKQTPDSKKIESPTSILLKPILLKSGLSIQFVYRFKTKELAKNKSLEESLEEIQSLIPASFLNIDLFKADSSSHFMVSKNGKTTLLHKNSKIERNVNYDHNKVRNHILLEQPLDFLVSLGVFTSDGKLKDSKREKFVQINKFLEFFAQLIKEANLKPPFSIVDMGSGKAYLTFAMYHYLDQMMGIETQIIGVEFRQDMVELCNGKSLNLNMGGLFFKQGTIDKFEIPKSTSVVIALHACDTATDDALYKAIKSESKCIMVAPCCHKQVRKDMIMPAELKSLESTGIIKERIAETLTDTIRALILEAYGYKTKVFEFVSASNTPKNLMITARHVGFSQEVYKHKINEIQILKDRFGISRHYLEEKLKIS